MASTASSYRFDADTGLWEHRARGRAAAADLAGLLRAPVQRLARAPESVLAGQLDALAIMREARACTAAPDDPPLKEIRWFPLPGDSDTASRARNTVVLPIARSRCAPVPSQTPVPAQGDRP